MHSGVVWLGALIVVNIAYVGWGWSLDRSKAPVPRPQLSSLGPSLRLLAELPPGEVKPVADPKLVVFSESEIEAPAEFETDAAALDGEPVQVVCHVWGPFQNRTELEKVEKDVVAAGGETRVTQSTVPGRSDYLVYIGTPGKAENARRILEELKSQDIDSALIARGRFNNTLSVGVFSRDVRAQRQLRRVTKLGYDAGIKEIERSHEVFHLEARVLANFEPPVAPNGPCSEIAQAH